MIKSSKEVIKNDATKKNSHWNEFCEHMNCQKEKNFDQIQNQIASEFKKEDSFVLYFLGFTSESTPYQKQKEIYSSLFSGFKKNIEQIVYPWHAEKEPYKFGDGIKTCWNMIFCCKRWKLDTNYRKAVQKSFEDSEELFQNFEKSGLENSPEMNFVGYSLGTQFIFNLLIKLQKANVGDKGNGDRDYIVNNVVFIAGVLSIEWLQSKLSHFFCEKGLIKGNIIIVKSKYDKTLSYLVKLFKVNSQDRDFDGLEEKNDDPIGYSKFDFDKAAKKIDKKVAPFDKMNDKEIKLFLEKRIKIIDCSKIIVNDKKVKINHFGYFKNDNFKIIAEMIKVHLNKLI